MLGLNLIHISKWGPLSQLSEGRAAETQLTRATDDYEQKLGPGSYSSSAL